MILKKKNIKGKPGTTVLICGLVMLGVLSSCHKENEPYPLTGDVASISYFGVSETFPYYEMHNNAYGGVGIFVDTLANNKNFINSQTGPTIPYFYFNGADAQAMFPFSYIDPSNTQPIYLDYKAGTRRFVFSYMIAGNGGTSSAVNTPVLQFADTTLSFKSSTHSCIYLTDAPAMEGDKAAYKIFVADEPLEKVVSADKVSLRFVHLSPDAGTLRIAAVRADGSEDQTLLPQKISFGNVSEYVQIDPSAFQNNKQIMLRVYGNDGAAPLFVTAVPAEPGHSFEVLIRGLKTVHQRQIATTINANNEPVWKTVELPISLAATTRQTH